MKVRPPKYKHAEPTSMESHTITMQDIARLLVKIDNEKQREQLKK